MHGGEGGRICFASTDSLNARSCLVGKKLVNLTNIKLTEKPSRDKISFVILFIQN